MTGNPVKLLLCDIDGTLTGANGRGHSVRLLPLIRRLMARGVRIGVVSGRDTASARVVHGMFDLNGPIIAENGAEVILRPLTNDRRTRICGGLSPPRIAALTKRIAQAGLLDALWIDREKKRMLTLYPNSFPHPAPSELRSLRGRLAALLEDSRFDVEITHSSAAIDICARGANKGRGMALACRSLRIAPRSIAFVGDSQNDQTAFDFVRRRRGWVAFVGKDQAMKRALEGYAWLYLARRSASEGSAEFIRFLLGRACRST